MIDSNHFSELAAADMHGMLPDDFSLMEAIGNAAAMCGMNPPKHPIDFRPKYKSQRLSQREKELKLAEKLAPKKPEEKKGRLTWRM